MTANDLAIALGVTRKTVYNWMARGNIPQHIVTQGWHYYSGKSHNGIDLRTVIGYSSAADRANTQAWEVYMLAIKLDLLPMQLYVAKFADENHTTPDVEVDPVTQDVAKQVLALLEQLALDMALTVKDRTPRADLIAQIVAVPLNMPSHEK